MTNIQVLPSSDRKLEKFHIYIDNQKWREMLDNEDLRFFMYNKNLTIFDQHNGSIVKLSSWDDTCLKHEYSISCKIRHKNIIKPLCYFEYEGNILKYFNSDIIDYQIENENKDDGEFAVLIIPFYKKIQTKDKIIVKQIVLFLHELLVKHKIHLERFCIDDIYYDSSKFSNIKYSLYNHLYYIRTNHIVKINGLTNAVVVKCNILQIHYINMYKHISKICEEFDCYDIVSYIEYAQYSEQPHNILSNILCKLN